MNSNKLIHQFGLITIISGALSATGALLVLVTVQYYYISNYFLILGKVLEPFAFLGIFLALGNIGSRTNFAGLLLAVMGHCLLLDGLFYPAGPVLLVIGIIMMVIVNQKRGKLPVWCMWLYLAGLLITFGMESVQYPIFRHGIGTLVYAIALIILGTKMRKLIKE